MHWQYIRLLFIVLIVLPTSVFCQIQINFQNGADGYTGCVDTYIDDDNPNSPFGISTGLLWDGYPSEYTTFIRFDNIFVSQGGPIPDNSYIISATLTYYVYDGGNDAAVSEVLISWDNSLTWNQFNFNTDVGTFVGTAESGTINTYESLDVTSSLSSWAANPYLNHGWIFQFTGNGGSDIYSSEWSTINQRPELTVEYSNNFPPNQPSLIAPADQSTNIVLSPSLIVNVTDPDNDNLDVRFYARAVSSDDTSFTIIGIPDTQYYTNNVNRNQYFYAQTDWVVANKDVLNIVYISQFGDCVQNGDTDDSQWQVVNTAWTTVENPITTNLADGMPYGLNVGNHDQSPIGGGSSASTNKFNEYFGVSRYQDRSYYGGHYGSNNDNHYDFFSASGMDFIVINLEYDTTPEQAVLDWADTLLKTYSNRRAIVVTHYLIETDDSIPPNVFGTQGQQIYNNLRDNSNLFLMLCGHNHGEGRRTDVFEGNTIYTLLADYQDYPNGGNSLLRIMEFNPSENKIYVSTYSPSLDQYEIDSNSQFDLDYDMGADSFQEIGYMSSVESGSDASFTWSSLSLDTPYEWYVEVSDGTSIITSPTWSFITEIEDSSLPVTLNQFSAKYDTNSIVLEWLTESEIHNLGFNVYRADSQTGPYIKISDYLENFDLKGLGNSSLGKEYSFVDQSIEKNRIYWYKISDVDYFGNEIFHNAISVTAGITESESFQIIQNYPNPFNPKTNIKYQLPLISDVELVIYNILGQKIATLVSGEQEAGHYQVEWDGSGFASGIYYYQITAGEFHNVKKMILIK